MNGQWRELSEAFRLMDEYIKRWMEAMRTPGMAVALFDQERCHRISTYGCMDLGTGTPVTPDTLFEIGSITKTFTAVAVLQAAEVGLLDLHTPITAYLPWFQVQSAYEPITIHHLLNHSAGMIGIIDQSPDIYSAVWMLRETELAWPPGKQFLYSDAGYQVLALILEAVTEKTYPEIIQQIIFHPLGMEDSSPVQVHAIRPRTAKGYTSLYDDRPSNRSHPLVEVPWIEVCSGECGIVSTAGDMAKFAQMLLNRGRGPAGRVLAEGSFELMIQNPMEVDWMHCQYGYGLEIHKTYEGVQHLAHGGGMPGYEARMVVDMENGIGVVMLSSRPSATSITWKLMSLWRAAYLGQTLGNVDLSIHNAMHVENAAEYEGTYFCENKVLNLVAEGDRLVLSATGMRVALEQRGKDAFYVPHPDFDHFLLRFGREPTEGEGKGLVTEAFYGEEWYLNSRYHGPRTFDVPDEWRAYPGHYRAHIPWQTNFRILLRKGALWWVHPEGAEEPLFSLSDGSFRLGDAPSPERIRFSQFIQGKACYALLSGSSYYRFFTP
jgi:CubicO group peptidase (beta-lactamase class C family)